MEPPVEIRYAGVIVGRAQEIRTVEGDQESFFLYIREPLPVGSTLQLRSGEKETPARVVQSVEALDPDKSGIQIRFIGAEEAETGLIPPPFNLEKFLAEAPPVKAPVVAPVRTTVSGFYPAVKAKAASSDAIPVIQAKATGSGAVPVASAKSAGSGAVPVASAKSADSEAVPIAVAKSMSEAIVTATRVAPAKPAGRTTLLMGSASEAVPVTVGRSVTDALYNATKSTEPIPAKETFPQGKETSPQGTVINETSTKATAVPVTVAETPSTSTSQSDPVVARPIVGPHKRGRSKKRK